MKAKYIIGSLAELIIKIVAFIFSAAKTYYLGLI